MSPDHEKLYVAVHEHDLRLVAVETEMRGVHNEMKELKTSVAENTQANRQLLATIFQIDLKAEKLGTTQRFILWILSVSATLITLLEAYAVFSS